MILLREALVLQGFPERIGAADIVIEGTVDEFDDLDVVKRLKFYKIVKRLFDTLGADLFEFLRSRQTVSTAKGTAARGFIIENIAAPRLVFVIGNITRFKLTVGLTA